MTVTMAVRVALSVAVAVCISISISIYLSGVTTLLPACAHVSMVVPPTRYPLLRCWQLLLIIPANRDDKAALSRISRICRYS